MPGIVCSYANHAVEVIPVVKFRSVFRIGTQEAVNASRRQNLPLLRIARDAGQVGQNSRGSTIGQKKARKVSLVHHETRTD